MATKKSVAKKSVKKKAPAPKATPKKAAAPKAKVKPKAAPKVEAEAPAVEEGKQHYLRAWLDGSPTGFAFTTKAARDAVYEQLTKELAGVQHDSAKTIVYVNAAGEPRSRVYVTVNKVYELDE